MRASRQQRALVFCQTRNKENYKRGASNSNWKGGRVGNGDGYIAIWVDDKSPYFSMSTLNGYVLEHRFIMAQHLNRCLFKSEQVHHINGIKDDNRIENLELISRTDHTLRSKLCGRCELRKEIRMLRWQIKEQSEQIKNLTSKLMGI